MLRIVAAILVCLVVSPAPAPRQALGQVLLPVDLGVPNLTQQTQVWCWAAVAQQIIYWLQGDSPPQCALVEAANGAPPEVCCVYQNPGCFTTGSLSQIQFLISYFGGSSSSLAPPADPMTVYNTLASGRPIIMAVQNSPFSGHVVVLTGMSWVPGNFGPEPVLHINDPLSWSFFGQPVAYVQLLPFWSAAIVVCEPGGPCP